VSNGKNGNSKRSGKGTPKSRLERVEETLGDPGDCRKRVDRRIAAILNGRVLNPQHRQAFTEKICEDGRRIKARGPSAEHDAAREADDKLFDAMSDAELLAWFRAQANAAWDELHDDGRQRIVDGLAQVDALRTQPPTD
jgi:hypothetical protein